jgi:hypothetical protein
MYTSRMDNQAMQKRKRGPAKGTPTEKYTLQLEAETAEWGKLQPGGLSELVRRLLRQAYQESQKA